MFLYISLCVINVALLVYFIINYRKINKDKDSVVKWVCIAASGSVGVCLLSYLLIRGLVWIYNYF